MCNDIQKRYFAFKKNFKFYFEDIHYLTLYRKGLHRFNN